MNHPNYLSPRLNLTAISAQDDSAIFKLFSDPLVVQYYDLEAFTEINQARSLIELFQTRFNNETGIRWAIRLRQSGQLIGTCGYNSWSRKMRNASLGYDLLPKFWGQGLAMEAVQTSLQAAFNGDLACGKLHRIQAETLGANQASIALLVKLGFQFEGIRRQAGYWNSQYQDLHCYGLLQPEYPYL